MKKISFLQSVLFLLLTATTAFSQNYPVPQSSSSYDNEYYDGGDYSQNSDPGAYDVFYDDLSPDGSWIDYPGYGYVWIPRVTADFQPYGTQGHWVMTNYGWTWVSDYRWGWAAFHYGRWAFEPRYGWMWIPGRQWGPAWVSWRQSDAYFGWAPLGPSTRIFVNINCPYDHYRFVPRRYFTNRNVYNYYADRRNNVTIINQTTYINETHIVNKNKYYYGPRKDFVERAVGQSIRVANVYDNPRPGAAVYNNDRMNVYRPRIDKAPVGVRPAPKRVASVSELQPISKDRELTPTVRLERPQNADGPSRYNREGGQTRSDVNQQRRNETPRSDPDVNAQPSPIRQQRSDVNQQRRNETPRSNPDVNAQPSPIRQQRSDVNQQRRDEMPRSNPDVNAQPSPIRQQRSDVNQQRRNEMPRSNPDVNRQPTQNNEVRQPRREKATQPERANEPAPRKGNNRGNDI